MRQQSSDCEESAAAHVAVGEGRAADAEQLDRGAPREHRREVRRKPSRRTARLRSNATRIISSARQSQRLWARTSSQTHW